MSETETLEDVEDGAVEDLAAAFARCKHLNVGAGPFRAPRPWWNIDARDMESADEIGDARDLTYPDDRFDRVYAGHVLEHLSPADVVTAIKEMRRVSTGEIFIVGPDVDRGAAMYARGEIDQATFDTLGAHGFDEEGNVTPPKPGDPGAHHWDSTLEKVCEFVTEAGLFPDRIRIVDVPLDWPVVSRVLWQCAVRIGPKE